MAIVFHLVAPNAESTSTQQDQDLSRMSLSELRERAMAAHTVATEAPAKEARRLYYQRSSAIRAYVLARAKDRCECCGQIAPFIRVDSTPYLEPHHMNRLSDERRF